MGCIRSLESQLSCAQGCARRSARLRESLLSLLFFGALLLGPSGTAGAQQGNNAVINSGGSPVASPSFFDATQFGGADPCKQIQSAFAALPSTGGTVDARGLIANPNTTLTCSVNPIPSGAKGRLLLSSGTYLAQMPWVIQSNDVSIVGTGPSDISGSNNTVIQACAPGQTGCAAAFPSGNAVIQMGTSSKTVYRSTVKELAVDCQSVAGVSGIQAMAAQEETVFDLVRADNCPVAGIDIGVGDAKTENGAALSNFEVDYDSGTACPTVTAGLISSATRNSMGVVTATLTVNSTPALVVGNEIAITGLSPSSFNGTYRVNSISGTGPFTFTYQTSATGGSTIGTVRGIDRSSDVRSDQGGRSCPIVRAFRRFRK
jgi:hypothetical protein